MSEGGCRILQKNAYPPIASIYFTSVIMETKLGAGGGVAPGVMGIFDLGGSLVRIDNTAQTIKAVPRYETALVAAANPLRSMILLSITGNTRPPHELPDTTIPMAKDLRLLK